MKKTLLFGCLIVAAMFAQQTTPEERGRAAGLAAIDRINREVDQKQDQRNREEATCHRIYVATSDTRIMELTTRDYFAAKTCVEEGLYK